MTIRVLVFLCFFCVSGLPGVAQKRVEKQDGFLHEVYHVLPGDTLVKNGGYQLRYKGDILEQGHYLNGQKQGRWQYFNFGHFFAYEYDYDLDSLLRFVPREGEQLLPGERPALFNGSPFIPYLFIVNNVFFPEKANRKGLEGQTILILEIDSLGAISDRYVSYSDHELFRQAVITASKKFPPKWNWLPARRDGKPVAGQFKMIIFFEQ